MTNSSHIRYEKNSITGKTEGLDPEYRKTPFSQEIVDYASDLYQNPDEKYYLLRFEELAQTINNQKLTPEQVRTLNPFNLLDQRLEIFDSHGVLVQTLDLNKKKLNKDFFSYTSLRTLYDSNKKELIFQATRGEKSDGSGGTIVVRHVISNIDVAAFDESNEVIMLVDSKGRISAIDKGYVVLNKFSAPIPVFKNLWVPTLEQQKKLEGAKFVADFHTVGVEPFTLNQITEDSVVPINKSGDLYINGGDLIVRYNQAGEVKLLGIFSREVTYSRLIQGTVLLQRLGELISPKEELIKKFVQSEARFERVLSLSSQDGTIPNHLDQILLNLDVEQIKNFETRQLELNNSSKKTTDRNSLDQWWQMYSDLKAKNPDLPSRELAKDWQNLLLNSHHNEAKLSQEDLKKELSQIRRHELTQAARYCGMVALFMAGGFLYTELPILENFFLTNWMYEVFASELKNIEYRVPLVKATAVWMSTFILPVLVSWVHQLTIIKLYDVYKEKESKFAQFVRDHYRKYAYITDWERITSFSSFFYAHIIYPVIRFVVESGLRGIPLNLSKIGLSNVKIKIPLFMGLNQKTIITARENSLNPFKLISKDSELGKSFGLDKSVFLGLNNPFKSDSNLRSDTDMKLALQEALVRQRDRNQMLAWILASYTVSEKTGVDMATLMQIKNGQFSRQELEDALRDPKMKRDWILTATEIAKFLTTKNAVGINSDFDKISNEDLEAYFNHALEIATAVKKRSEFRKEIEYRSRAIKKILKSTENWLTSTGREESIFLKTNVTNRPVAQMTSEAFVVDQTLTVNTTNYIGARTNFSDPDHLAAKADGFLWGTPGYNFEMMQNSYIHLMVAGATNALVHQKLKPANDTLFDPKENILFKQTERKPTLLGKNFLRPDFEKGDYQRTVEFLAKLDRSDIGGLAWTQFKKRFNTLQAGLFATFVFRYLAEVSAGHNFMPEEAFKAWILFFIAGTWIYGWVWLPVQQSIKLPALQIEKRMEFLREARALINQGLSESDPVISRKKIRDGQRMIYALYEKDGKNVLEEGVASAQKLLTDEKIYDMDLSQSQKKYYGVFYKMKVAQEAGDQKTYEEAKMLLRQNLSQDANLDMDQLNRLDGQGLIELSMKHSPVYTATHKFTSEFNNILGGFFSTVLFIKLSVIAFKPEIMTWGYVAEWLAISAALYGGTYFFMSTDGIHKLRRIKKEWQEKRELKRLSQSCTALFG